MSCSKPKRASWNEDSILYSASKEDDDDALPILQQMPHPCDGARQSHRESNVGTSYYGHELDHHH
eukprot:4145870-Amphidinium_carterae.1